MPKPEVRGTHLLILKQLLERQEAPVIFSGDINVEWVPFLQFHSKLLVMELRPLFLVLSH